MKANFCNILTLVQLLFTFETFRRLFKQIKSQIDLTQDYKGQELLVLVSDCIRTTTESILANK